MGTYGEYLKTRAAKAESDSAIRKYINHLIKEFGYKLLKYQVGKPGTLDYGRVVVLFQVPLFRDNPKMQELLKKKAIMYSVTKANFGKLERSLGKTYGYKDFSYKSRVLAEKKYNEEVRSFLR